MFNNLSKFTLTYATHYNSLNTHNFAIANKVADWNRKEFLTAKLRAAVKNLLIKVINGRGTYTDIEQLSEEILTHAETVYALQQRQP